MANCWYKTKLDHTGIINQNFTLPDLPPSDDGTYNIKPYPGTQSSEILSPKIIALMSGLNMPVSSVGLSYSPAGAPVPNELRMILDTVEYAPGAIRNWSMCIGLTDTPITLNWYELDNNEDPRVLGNVQTGRGGIKEKRWPASRGRLIDSLEMSNKEIVMINGAVPAKASGVLSSDAWFLEINTLGQEKTFEEQVEILEYHKLIVAR